MDDKHIKADILAIGVHPDDVELGCSGTILACVAQGKTVVVADLTEGELGTRGTRETRKTEAARAGSLMGIASRENLGMRDGFFENNEENLRKVITCIRKYRPGIIICNAYEDRHPDHGRSSKLVEDAAFLSGLRKIETSAEGVVQEQWKPSYVLHYIQDRYLKPDFVFDISPWMERKIEVIQAYSTQFHSEASAATDEPQTYISTPDFLDVVRARALMLGKRIGVGYAEGYLTQKMIGVSSFDALIQNIT